MSKLFLLFLVLPTTLLGACISLDVGGYVSDSTIKSLLYIAVFAALIRTFYLAHLLEKNKIKF